MQEPVGTPLQIPETILHPGKQSISDDAKEQGNKSPFRSRDLSSNRAIRRAERNGRQTGDKCVPDHPVASHTVHQVTRVPALNPLILSGNGAQSPTVFWTSPPDAATFSEEPPPAGNPNGSFHPQIDGSISVPSHDFGGPSYDPPSDRLARLPFPRLQTPQGSLSDKS